MSRYSTKHPAAKHAWMAPLEHPMGTLQSACTPLNTGVCSQLPSQRSVDGDSFLEPALLPRTTPSQTAVVMRMLGAALAKDAASV